MYIVFSDAVLDKASWCIVWEDINSQGALLIASLIYSCDRAYLIGLLLSTDEISHIWIEEDVLCPIMGIYRHRYIIYLADYSC